MSKIRKPVIDAVEEALTGAKVARTVAKDAKPLRGVLSPVTAKPSRVPTSSASPLADVRGTTPAVQAQNASVEKLLPKDQVERVANAIRMQKEYNKLGISVPMTNLGVSSKDILAYQTAMQMSGSSPSAITAFRKFMDQVDQANIQTNSTMPLGNAEELRKAIGLESGLGVTDTSAPVRYTDSSGKVVQVPTGVGYANDWDGWGNAESARPKTPYTSIILQGEETGRPIKLDVRADGSYAPSNLYNLQPENQIDVAVGKIDARGMDFPTYPSDAVVNMLKKSLNKEQEKQFIQRLIERSYTSNWDKTKLLEKYKQQGKKYSGDKGISPDQLQLFRDTLKKGGGLDALTELFGENRKFRKVFADTLSASDTSRGIGVPHYFSYTNAMLADPVKRTQFGQTAQLILKPTGEGMDVANLSPDYQFEYPWHTPTDMTANLYGENVPRSLMYRTGTQELMQTNPNINPVSLTNRLLKKNIDFEQRTIKLRDAEEAIRFSQLWKKATSGQGLTKEEADELLRLDALRRFNY